MGELDPFAKRLKKVIDNLTILMNAGQSIADDKVRIITGFALWLEDEVMPHINGARLIHDALSKGKDPAKEDGEQCPMGTKGKSPAIEGFGEENLGEEAEDPDGSLRACIPPSCIDERWLRSLADGRPESSARKLVQQSATKLLDLSHPTDQADRDFSIAIEESLKTFQMEQAKQAPSASSIAPMLHESKEHRALCNFFAIYGQAYERSLVNRGPMIDSIEETLSSQPAWLVSAAMRIDELAEYRKAIGAAALTEGEAMEIVKIFAPKGTVREDSQHTSVEHRCDDLLGDGDAI